MTDNPNTEEVDVFAYMNDKASKEMAGFKTAADSVSWTAEDDKLRKAAFNKWISEHKSGSEIRLLPAKYQGIVHEMLRTAYYAGDNRARKLARNVNKSPGA